MEDGRAYIENSGTLNRWIDIICEYAVKVNGSVVGGGKLDLAGIAPHEEKSFPVPVPREKGYTFVDFTFSKGGKIVAVRQAEIDYAYAAAEKAESEDVSFEVDENGMLKSFRAAGREYLAGAAKLQILRAYLDNDRNVKNDWERVRYQYADFFAKNIERKEGCVRVSGYMVTDSIAPLAEICLTYKPVAGGVEIFAEVFGNGHFPRFPRFGFSFPVAPSLTKVEYFGRGETEAYLDRTLCAPVGFYVADARTMNYMYPKPQESGSHCGSRFVKISDGKGGIMADSEKDFSFQVSEYALSDYRAHAYEMKETGRLYLNVDYKMAALAAPPAGRCSKTNTGWSIRSASVSVCLRRRAIRSSGIFPNKNRLATAERKRRRVMRPPLLSYGGIVDFGKDVRRFQFEYHGTEAVVAADDRHAFFAYPVAVVKKAVFRAVRQSENVLIHRFPRLVAKSLRLWHSRRKKPVRLCAWGTLSVRPRRTRRRVSSSKCVFNTVIFTFFISSL